MRIVHLGKYYSPDRGGIEEVTETLACGSVRAGHDVAVLCFTKDPRVSEALDGVHVERHLARSIPASQPLSWSYFQQARRIHDSADVIHIHAPNLLAALATALTPRRRAAVVVHWHSDIVSKGWLGRLVKPIEWLMLRRADAVIATSAAYMEGSAWLRRFRTKVSVIPLGIHDRFGTQSQAHARAGEVRTILAVGRLVPYKGFEHLIDAAPFLPNGCKVVIAGDGPQRAELQARIDRLGVGDRVTLAGRVPHDELQVLYRDATLFCLPSVERSEAFGVVLLEALCAGLPVVACEIPGSGVPWVNQHGVTGFNVPVRDARALAAACSELLSDPELRLRQAEAARSRYEAVFTAGRTLDLTMGLYQSLRGGSHGGKRS